MKNFFAKRVVALALVFSTLLLGCKSSFNQSTTAPVEEESAYSLKISASSSDSHQIITGLQFFASRVANETNNKVQIDIYPSNQLGSASAILDEIKNGANLGIVIDTNILAHYVPDMAIYNGSYMFSDVNVARQFIETEVFQSWKNELAELGLHNFGCNWYRGRLNFWSNHNIQKMADLSGLRIGVLDNAVIQKSIEAFGAIPVPLSWNDASSALENGVIDGIEASSAPIYSSSVYKTVPYCAVSDHLLLYGGLVISESWYQNLPESYQKVLSQQAIEAGDYATKETLAKEVEYNELMAERGVQFTQIDQKPFLASAAEVYESMGWSHLKKQINDALER